MADYRKIYKEYFGIDFGKDYAIHHIDFNHDNNDINNLVLMPKKVHSQFHFSANQLKEITLVEIFENCMISQFSEDYTTKIAKNFLNDFNTYHYWFDLKSALNHYKMTNSIRPTLPDGVVYKN